MTQERVNPLKVKMTYFNRMHNHLSYKSRRKYTVLEHMRNADERIGKFKEDQEHEGSCEPSLVKITLELLFLAFFSFLFAFDVVIGLSQSS